MHTNRKSKRKPASYINRNFKINVTSPGNRQNQILQSSLRDFTSFLNIIRVCVLHKSDINFGPFRVSLSMGLKSVDQSRHYRTFFFSKSFVGIFLVVIRSRTLRTDKMIRIAKCLDKIYYPEFDTTDWYLFQTYTMILIPCSIFVPMHCNSYSSPKIILMYPRLSGSKTLNFYSSFQSTLSHCSNFKSLAN